MLPIFLFRQITSFLYGVLAIIKRLSEEKEGKGGKGRSCLEQVKSFPKSVWVCPLSAEVEETHEVISMADIELVKILAQKRNQNAMAQLGYYYLQGCTRDSEKAERWLRLAYEQNSNASSAYWALGLMHLEGLTLVPIYIRGLRTFFCFEKAADEGHIGALYNLGMCYKHGVRVVRNKEMALHKLVSAAEGNWPDAQYEIGKYYLGKEHNLSWASHYFHLAAEQGNKKASHELKKTHELRVVEKNSVATLSPIPEGHGHTCNVM